MKKLINKGLITIVICISMTSVSFAAEPSSWASEAVNTMNSSDLVPAYLQSNYQTPMTREDFCNLIIKATGLEPEASELSKNMSNPFTDTKNPNIVLAYHYGLISGTSNTMFTPSKNINRQEAAQILFNLSVSLNSAFDKEFSKVPKSFPDSSSISDWAKEAVDVLSASGIMNGTDKGFDPLSLYTREQSILTLYNLLMRLGVDDYKVPETPKSETVAPSTTGYPEKVVEIVNSVRAEKGLPALIIDPELMKIANFKSSDMIATDNFSHDSVTYGSFSDLFQKFNYESMASGENIAAGQKTPEDVMKSWINSPGHYENITNSNFTKIGVGYVLDKDGVPYWTQEFSSN